MAEERYLKGYITHYGAISGRIRGIGEITGTVNPGGLKLTGTVASSMGEHIETYEGPYEATPTLDTQILQTKRKKMSLNVTVNATPISEVVSVDTGGYTITVL